MRHITKRELRPFNPYRPFEQFFNNEMANFWSGDNFLETPAFNIIEGNDRYVIELAAPGLDKDDFNIEIKDQILTIKVQKEESKDAETTDNNTKYIKREFSFNQFSRSFTLDKTIAQNDIEATYDNGILRVSLKKAVNPEIIKKIEIK